MRTASNWFQWPRLRYRANAMVWLLRCCLGEIARATVVLPEPLLPNVIVMNCDVEVRDSQRKPSSTCALSFLARRPW